MKKNLIASVTLAVATAFGASAAMAQDTAPTLDALLTDIKASKYAMSKDYDARQKRFMEAQSNQKQLLGQAEAEEKRQERLSKKLESDFAKNKIQIGETRKRLKKAKGDLNELFGHLQGFAGDARETFKGSITSAQYGQREEAITKMIAKLDANSTTLPTISEVEALWYEVQRELVATGEVVKFEGAVKQPDGSTKQQEIVRVGVFNLVSEGDYLTYDAALNSVAKLPAQPKDAQPGAVALQAADSGLVAFEIDPSGPTGGTLLKALIDAPDVKERIKQGGTVGYIIISIGIIGILIALWRFIALSIMSGKVRKQAKSKEINTNNPLGRVLQVAEDNKSADLETLELKVAEQILKDRPSIEKGVAIIKIIGAVAPLLGLLGTVTGMILTFQAITIFGAGDPTAMAGGISAALMTTVLGLCVAIPMILLHTIVAGSSKSVMTTLEEQATGIIAKRSEEGK